MPTNSRGPNNSGSRPSGKGSPVGGSFLSLPKDTVKPPPPRPAPSIITQPPANKLRQPPPKIVEPPPPPPPPAISAAAGGGAAGGLNVGAVASALAIAIALVLFFDEPLSKDQANVKLQPPEPPKDVEPPDYPFYGGQMPGVLYDVTYELGGSNVPKYVDTKRYYGPIVSTRFQQFDGGNTVYYIRTGGFYFFGYKPPSTKDQITNLFGMQNPFIRITSIRRVEAAPDTGGNPPPQNQPSVSSPGNSLGAPSAAPPSAAPSPAPRAPGISGSPGTGPSGAPGGFPGSLPGGSPGSSPSGFPGGFPSPAPAPKKGPAPQPNKYPGPAPSPSPSPSPNGDPGPAPGPGVGGPAPAPTPNGVPKIGPAPYVSPPPVDPTKYPDTGFQPNIFQPNPLTPNPLTPNPLGPTPFTPNPNTGDPELKKAPPLIEPPKTPDPTPTPTEDLGKQIQNWLGPLTIALAGITGLVQPDALKNAANAGTCEAFSPTGCAAPVANNAQRAADNSARNGTVLASILAFLQALQAAFMVPILAGVNLINTKLGPVMSGLNGIGGFLSRTAEAAKLDKVLNAMNTILLLHNAAMLSRNLGSTLGDLTSQALSTIGIKDGDSPIDVNEILGKQANNFMASILGAEVWAGTKSSWNKASSIIASATNLMYTVRSMFDSTREILEWTAENTGKIGNALKRFRIVGENAYKWLPERVTVPNRFTQRLDKIREGTDSLDDAASSLSGVLGEVQSIQSEYADLQEQKQKFDKNISELTPKPRDEISPLVTR